MLKILCLKGKNEKHEQLIELDKLKHNIYKGLLNILNMEKLESLNVGQLTIGKVES